jgi:hypothetical protein
MSDRVLLSLAAGAAVLLIAFASIWPQGYGARSLGPFGHTPIQQTPEMKAAMAREREAEIRRHAANAAAAGGLRPGQ